MESNQRWPQHPRWSNSKVGDDTNFGEDMGNHGPPLLSSTCDAKGRFIAHSSSRPVGTIAPKTVDLLTVSSRVAGVLGFEPMPGTGSAQHVLGGLVGCEPVEGCAELFLCRPPAQRLRQTFTNKGGEGFPHS
jgi:hypothetical protein